MICTIKIDAKGLKYLENWQAWVIIIIVKLYNHYSTNLHNFN